MHVRQLHYVALLLPLSPAMQASSLQLLCDDSSAARLCGSGTNQKKIELASYVSVWLRHKHCFAGCAPAQQAHPCLPLLTLSLPVSLLWRTRTATAAAEGASGCNVFRSSTELASLLHAAEGKACSTQRILPVNFSFETANGDSHGGTNTQ
jgi:hypothetical protein